eukprot:scaffold3134_cov414-Prasinococcus_capsulatus_cf.AAC.11
MTLSSYLGDHLGSYPCTSIVVHIHMYMCSAGKGPRASCERNLGLKIPFHPMQSNAKHPNLPSSTLLAKLQESRRWRTACACDRHADWTPTLHDASTVHINETLGLKRFTLVRQELHRCPLYAPYIRPMASKESIGKRLSFSGPEGGGGGGEMNASKPPKAPVVRASHVNSSSVVAVSVTWRADQFALSASYI